MAIYKVFIEWELQADDQRQCGLVMTADPAADEGAAETAFDAFWASLKAVYMPETKLVGYRWYEGPSGDFPNIEWGDTFRVTPRSVPGTAIAPHKQLPPQCSIVLTWLMPIDQKRHRGRIYLPAPSTEAMDGAGRIMHPGDWADTTAELLDALVAASFQPAVYAHTGPGGAGAALSIPRVRVDNVFDTQRRRGYEASTNTQTRDVDTL